MEIKFRKKDLVKTMRRIDTVYARLVEQLGKGRALQPLGLASGELKHLPQTPWWQAPENPFVFINLGKFLMVCLMTGPAEGLWRYLQIPICPGALRRVLDFATATAPVL